MVNRRYRNKRFVLLPVLVLILLLLAGCGGNASQTGTPSAVSASASRPDTMQNGSAPETAPVPETMPPEITGAAPAPSGTLVVYFSATGHTKPIAEYAAEYLNADLYEIVPETAYTEEDLNYNDSSTRATMEQHDAAARPAIKSPLPDISAYDTIIIGHPIWWGQAPKIIYTFLESYDWSGKTLVTFCTSASSGLGSSAENLKPAAPGNPVWLESRRFSIGTGMDETAGWLRQLLR